jgi:cytochrome P450
MSSSTEFFDPFQEALKADPYPVYRRYLEAGSIQRGKPPMPEYPESWYVFGFYEASTVLRNPDFVHDRSKVLPSHDFAQDLPAVQQAFWGWLGKMILLRDPPSHTAQRALISRQFSQSSVQQLGDFIEAEADSLLDHAMRRNGFDLMWEFAYPLSLKVITHILGTPMPDLHWFKSCTRAIAAALSVRNSNNAYAGGATAFAELLEFLHECLAVPGSDLSSGSVLSQLQALSVDGRDLADDIIIPLMSLLLFAGQETVSDAIGNGMITLFNHPIERARLVSNPQLMSAAVEEILRFEAPVQYTVARTAATDIEIGGIRIRRGEPVTVVLGAACRDPRRYPDPDRFDVSRPSTGDTLVFGKGIHFCLGVHLARLTLRIAFSKLLTRLPSHWTITGVPTWRDNISLRGPASLLIGY